MRICLGDLTDEEILIQINTIENGAIFMAISVDSGGTRIFERKPVFTPTETKELVESAPAIMVVDENPDTLYIPKMYMLGKPIDTDGFSINMKNAYIYRNRSIDVYPQYCCAAFFQACSRDGIDPKKYIKKCVSTTPS